MPVAVLPSQLQPTISLVGLHIRLPPLSLFVAATMVKTAAQIKSDQLIARRATLEQELRDVRMQLKEASLELAKERKEKAKEEKEKKAEKVKKGALKKTERLSLRICKTTGAMVGWSREGKTRYGPGYACWQCEHRARGKPGGHKHSCGKVPYAR